MKQVQLYDDQLEFAENNSQGPFGDYADHSQIYKNSGQPQFDFFGIPVYSPFGIAAGPLPTARHIKSALDKGFDIVTLKSVRTDTFPLNTYPHVRPVLYKEKFDPNSIDAFQLDSEYREKIAVANSFGIPSVKPEVWQSIFKDCFQLPTAGQALLVAFQGTAHGKGRDDFVQDHVKGVSLVKETGARIIEVNLSCPNEGEAVLACFDLDITERIVNAVKEAHPDITLIIKLAYFSDKSQLEKLVKKVGHLVDGISAINTIPMPVKDASGKDVFPGREKAGISGAPVKWAGLEMTKSLNGFRQEHGYDYKIVGMGGVLNYSDFNDYRNVGADIVMSVSGAIWNPNLAAEIKESLLQ